MFIVNIMNNLKTIMSKCVLVNIMNKPKKQL